MVGLRGESGADHLWRQSPLGLGECCCRCIDLLADTRIDEGSGAGHGPGEADWTGRGEREARQSREM